MILRRSKTYAVFTDVDSDAKIYYMYAVVDPTTNQPVELKIDKKVYKRPFLPRERDDWIEHTVRLGSIARHYDSEEKRWMETDMQFGSFAVPGDRDGTWGQPSLEEFKKNYIGLRS